MRNKKGQYNPWYMIITAILVVLVVTVGVLLILGINPIKVLVDLLPVFNSNGENGNYQGLCHIGEPAVFFSKGKVKSSSGNYYCEGIVYISGTEDCVGDEISVDCWKTTWINQIVLKGKRFEFDEDLVISKFLKNFEVEENYYCQFKIYGKNPLLIGGGEYKDKLKFKAEC